MFGLSPSRRPWFYNSSFLEKHADAIHGNVIDIGCGDRKYESLIVGIPQVQSYTGLDIEGTPATIFGDLNAPLAIADAVYDTGICISVLEHLYHPQVALQEMARILKPGSKLLLSVPWIFPYHGVPMDYFRYSRDALTKLLNEAGFEVIDCLPGGGKLRIITLFICRWLPIHPRLLQWMDYAVSRIENEDRIRRIAPLNTTSHHVLAVRTASTPT